MPWKIGVPLCLAIGVFSAPAALKAVSETSTSDLKCPVTRSTSFATNETVTTYIAIDCGDDHARFVFTVEGPYSLTVASTVRCTVEESALPYYGTWRFEILDCALRN